ncbi:MAG: RNA polymerase sigma-70 factor [Dysgonomonas sp.]|jgi:RNA polymerase sigma-70 factor (ECF subfamily)|nr:RNA polymerase sigma-70 factor [Prevotella sp.]
MERKNSYDHLFDLIRNDDTEAFDRLYSLFYPSLCVFASRYISEYKAIEDCVQDVFLKIWRDRKTILINTSVRSYLFTSIRNHCLNLIEKEKIELTYEQYILNTYDPYTSNDLYSIEELENIIENAIQKLPEKIQQVFRMSRFEQMTYKEIAEKQNISIKTVESYIHKALIMLSISLKDYLPFITFLFFFKKI